MGCRERGGPMDDAPGSDRDLPIDADEDADNSAIHVQGLSDNVTLDDLADFRKQCGVVKMNKITGQLMIHIYLDKKTGRPKGDTTVAYEDLPTAKAAVEWLVGKDIQESKLKASHAQKKPSKNRKWSGMPPHEGRGMPPPLCGGHNSQRGPKGTVGRMGGNGRDEGASQHENPGAPEGPLWRRKSPALSWRLAVSHAWL